MGGKLSSVSKEVPFRSPAGRGSGNGESSGKGSLGEGITSFLAVANPPSAPCGNGIDSGLCKEPEDDEDGFDYENANYGLVMRNSRIAQDIAVTFLGTSSGGGPTRTRNCSSLLVDMVGDGSLWSAYSPYRIAYLPQFFDPLGHYSGRLRGGHDKAV